MATSNTPPPSGLVRALTQNAVEAVRQWLFEPCTCNGKPVGVRYTLTVRYHMESSP